MQDQSKYSAALTGAPFMHYEFKQVIMLKNEGYSDQEIRNKVIDENLFQYGKTSSLKRGLPYIIKRVNALNGSLRKLVIEESFNVVKVVNLYAIMKTDRLFFEFMNELVSEKLRMNNHVLERKDINAFFTSKAEQNETIANWTEHTVNKLRQVYVKILLETGIVKDLRTMEMNHLMIDERIKEQLIHIGDAIYVRAMGEG